MSQFLELSNQLIKVGPFGVELGDTSSQSTQIRDKTRVLLQDVANGVELVARGGVELGGFDQVGGNFEIYR